MKWEQSDVGIAHMESFSFTLLRARRVKGRGDLAEAGITNWDTYFIRGLPYLGCWPTRTGEVAARVFVFRLLQEKYTVCMIVADIKTRRERLSLSRSRS